MWTNSTPVTPGADHDHVLGDHLRRVAVARGEDALAVGLAPSRGCAGREPVAISTASAGMTSLAVDRGRPRPRAGRGSGPCPLISRTRWLSSSAGDAVLQAALDALDPVRQRRRGRPPASLLLQPHAPDALGEAHGAAGRDHRLGRDAVPQVRSAADDVALDERDLGARAGRRGWPRCCRPGRHR